MVPTRHLRPIPRPAARVPMSAPELDVTPTEPAVARRRERERQQTLAGIGPDEAPRSLSPVPAERSPLPAPKAPESERPVVRVETPGGGELGLKKRHLRALWTWVAPLVVSALGFVGSAIRGYYLGLAMAHDEVVRIRENQQLDHDRITKLETRTEADEASAAQEAQSNRSERATAMRKLEGFASDLELVKNGKPKPATRGQPDLVDAVRNAIQSK